MAIRALLLKDLLEHRFSAVTLAAGAAVLIMLLLMQNEAATYSMSAFEIVRFALLSVVPLIALITGNRLIVNEYLSRTHQFVEALPVSYYQPLALKYLLGLGYLVFIVIGMVLLASTRAGIADDATLSYTVLITGKAIVISCLYWSVVFCFSLCGYLRIVLYALAAIIVAAIAWHPLIDSDSVAPFALLDDQLFVFERDLIPWRDILITLSIAALFTISGFVLARLGDGSVVERLAKPMTRRDFVALGVLAVGGLTVWSSLQETNEPVRSGFSSNAVVRLQDPEVSVLYLEDQYRQSGEQHAERLHTTLIVMQQELGLPALPPVRLALEPGRERHDLDYSTSFGAFVTANWLDHDSYDDAVLDAVVLHGVLSAQTNQRAVFEPYHWVLDGFTRWWVEEGLQPMKSDHRVELLARAIWTLDVWPEADSLIDNWQLTADRFSYPAAEALAWSAMHYLASTEGRGRVMALANEFLTEPLGSSSLASLRDRFSKIETRTEQALGQPVKKFLSNWSQWLQAQRTDPAIQEKLNRIPALSGTVRAVDDGGVVRIEAGYQREPGWGYGQSDTDLLSGLCIMKHNYLGPFDTEFEVSDDYEQRAECALGESVHSLNSFYASGDRIVVALEYVEDGFRQPLRLYTIRFTVP